MKDLQKRSFFYQNGTNVYKRLRGNGPGVGASPYKTFYTTPPPTPLCNKDVQIIFCRKRHIFFKKQSDAKGLSDEYQCKFQFVF